MSERLFTPTANELMFELLDVNSYSLLAFYLIAIVIKFAIVCHFYLIIFQLLFFFLQDPLTTVFIYTGCFFILRVQRKSVLRLAIRASCC